MEKSLSPALGQRHTCCDTHWAFLSHCHPDEVTCSHMGETLLWPHLNHMWDLIDTVFLIVTSHLPQQVAHH